MEQLKFFIKNRRRWTYLWKSEPGFTRLPWDFLPGHSRVIKLSVSEGLVCTGFVQFYMPSGQQQKGKQSSAYPL